MEAIYGSTFPYCLVKFAEEGSISVVPTSWLVEEEMTVHTFWPPKKVKRHVTYKSNPEDGWKMFSVKVVHYSKSYSSAVESLRFFKLYSDIELCSEDDSESSNGPSLKLEESNVPDASSRLNLETGFLTVPQVTHCSSCQENKEMFEKAMTKLDCIMEDVKELKHHQHLSLPQSRDNPLFQNYPLSSVEGVIALEEELIDPDLFSKLAKYLGQHGGRDVNDCTRRVLSLLMTNETARMMNWVGGTGKLGMKTCPKIVQLIADAVRQTDKNVKQAAVEEIIKRWLRTALDRDGGRTKRKIASLGI